MTSLYPHLFRAFYDWLIENDLNLKIFVDASHKDVVVPPAYVTDNTIVLSVYHQYISQLEIGEQGISFYTRFKGKSEYIVVPYDAILDFIFVEQQISIPIQAMIYMFKESLRLNQSDLDDEDEIEEDSEESSESKEDLILDVKSDETASKSKAKGSISFTVEDDQVDFEPEESAEQDKSKDQKLVTTEEEKSEEPPAKKNSKPSFTFVE